MRKYPQFIDIQMAATACLFDLTKDALKKKIDGKITDEIIDALLLSMNMFPNDVRLKKNILTILCNSVILPFLNVDRINLFDTIFDFMKSNIIAV